MLSQANEKKLQRRYDNERAMTQRKNRAHKIAFVKRLAKAIGIGLFAYITMLTEQVADWIAIPMIYWSICYGTWTVDKYVERGWTPWQR